MSDNIEAKMAITRVTIERIEADGQPTLMQQVLIEPSHESMDARYICTFVRVSKANIAFSNSLSPSPGETLALVVTDIEKPLRIPGHAEVVRYVHAALSSLRRMVW